MKWKRTPGFGPYMGLLPNPWDGSTQDMKHEYAGEYDPKSGKRANAGVGGVLREALRKPTAA